MKTYDEFQFSIVEKTFSLFPRKMIEKLNRTARTVKSPDHDSQTSLQLNTHT